MCLNTRVYTDRSSSTCRIERALSRRFGQNLYLRVGSIFIVIISSDVLPEMCELIPKSSPRFGPIADSYVHHIAFFANDVINALQSEAETEVMNLINNSCSWKCGDNCAQQTSCPQCWSSLEVKVHHDFVGVFGTGGNINI